jgi:hypothetical protein
MGAQIPTTWSPLQLYDIAIYGSSESSLLYVTLLASMILK